MNLSAAPEDLLVRRAPEPYEKYAQDRISLQKIVDAGSSTRLGPSAHSRLQPRESPSERCSHPQQPEASPWPSPKDHNRKIKQANGVQRSGRLPGFKDQAGQWRSLRPSTSRKQDSAERIEIKIRRSTSRSRFGGASIHILKVRMTEGNKQPGMEEDGRR